MYFSVSKSIAQKKFQQSLVFELQAKMYASAMYFCQKRSKIFCFYNCLSL